MLSKSRSDPELTCTCLASSLCDIRVFCSSENFSTAAMTLDSVSSKQRPQTTVSLPIMYSNRMFLRNEPSHTSYSVGSGSLTLFFSVRLALLFCREPRMHRRSLISS
ncbi:unnamed protein product, partial [Ixodes pacificus]